MHFRGFFVEGTKEPDLTLMAFRKVFDNFLLEKARETGIDVLTGEKVLDYIENEDYLKSETNTIHV